MYKTLLLVRHGQGHHNVALQQLGHKAWFDTEAYDPKYLDARLTPLGEQQAKDLGRLIQTARGVGLKVDRAVVSPLSRYAYGLKVDRAVVSPLSRYAYGVSPLSRYAYGQFQYLPHAAPCYSFTLRGNRSFSVLNFDGVPATL